MYRTRNREHRVVDADSHVVEPLSAWDGIEARFRDRVPRLVDVDGNDWLVCEDRRLMAAAHMSGLTRRDASLPVDGALAPSRWDTAVMKGGYDVEARLVDMDTDGVDIGILYPTVALTLYGLDDRELLAALLRAYNDWLADLCAAAPARLRGIGALTGEASEDTVAEIARCRGLGHVGLLIPLYDDRDTDFGAPEWDAVWGAAEDAGMPIGFHAFVRGPGGRATVTEPTLDALVERPARVQRALLALVLGHVFARFPALRIVSAENEAGWAAPLIERADTAYRRGRFRALPGGDLDRAPGDIIREHVFLTVIDDRTALHALDILGHHNVMWSSDYPHNVSTWPHSADHLATAIADAALADEDVARLVGANAAALYGL